MSCPSYSVDTDTETDISQTDSDISQSETDISQTETDISQTETDISQSETDISQSTTDISQSTTDIPVSPPCICALCIFRGAYTQETLARSLARSPSWEARGSIISSSFESVATSCAECMSSSEHISFFHTNLCVLHAWLDVA